MARSSIELIVDASKAVNPLKRVTAETKKLENATRDANGRLREAKGKFVAVGKSANKASGGLKNFGSGLGGIKKAIGGIGLGLLTKQVVGAAASFNSLQLRLKLLTQQYGETEQAQEVISRSAKKFGLSNREAAEGVTDIFARLRPLGVSLKDIESTFVGFNTVAKLSGVESQQASAAFTQLAQALGSGALQGDEFRSIAEQVPGLLTAVSDVTGVAQGELKKFASEGLLTSDIVIQALKRAEKDGGAAIAQIIEESDVQKFKDFENATDDLAIAVGDALLPVVTPAAEAITDLVNGIAKIPAPAGQAALAIGGVALALKAVNTAIIVFKGSQLAAFIGTQIALYKTFGAQIYLTAAAQGALNKALALGKLALLALPFAAVAGAAAFFIADLVRAQQEQANFNSVLETGTKKMLENALATERANLARAESFVLQGRGAGRAAFQAPIDRAEMRIKQLEAKLLGIGVVDAPPEIPASLITPAPTPDTVSNTKLRERKDLTAEMNALLEKQQQLAHSTDKIAKSRLVKEIEYQRIIEAQMLPLEEQRALRDAEIAHERVIAQVMTEKLNLIAKSNEVRRDGVKSVFEDVFAEGKKIDDQLEGQAEKMRNLYKSIGDSIQSGIVDSLVAAIDGTKSLAEIAQGVLKDIGRTLIQFGLNTFFNSLGSGGSGGLGDAIGRIFRADGGPVDQNSPYIVGERGPELFVPGQSGQVVSNDNMRSAMGRYQRSAGLPGGASQGGATDSASGGVAVAAPIDVRYTVERINSVDYVTADQFQVGMRQAATQGAKQGEQRALTTLRQNTTQRKRVGLQ